MEILPFHPLFFDGRLADVKHQSIHFSFSFPLKWNSRKKSKKKHPPLFFSGPLNVTLMWRVTLVLFVNRLSSSSKHKDYCFCLCTEYFGHFAPVIHIYRSLSIQQRERRGGVTFFFFPWTALIFPVNGQKCDCPIYTKDQLPVNCSHKDRFTNSRRRALPSDGFDAAFSCLSLSESGSLH